eukprot:CAMPEP_0201655900 /NCGR_PEP_ID=MMETSP0493-20130528/46252_1 /ASSEMBLY_ACC=CAM_ASM_000838 /TAXON_ID=420259 /ORGANISM="Thalassiosira gravida, Strain GMp14c1" /LENGTH=164 /DNA_ID=CAMNT_0048132499 /DNA_START=147 /DNA_END=642 /DNA_ORIENTATION=+
MHQGERIKISPSPTFLKYNGNGGSASGSSTSSLALMIPIFDNSESIPLFKKSIANRNLSAARRMLNGDVGPSDNPWAMPTPKAQSPTIIFKLTNVFPSDVIFFRSAPSFKTYNTTLKYPNLAIEDIVKLVDNENNPPASDRKLYASSGTLKTTFPNVTKTKKVR